MNLTLLFAAVLPFCLCNCDKKTESGSSGSSSPSDSSSTGGAAASKLTGTEAEAKEMLSAFLKPGADVKALSEALRPTDADYEAVFVPDFAAKLKAWYTPLWDAGKLTLEPEAKHTEVSLTAIPVAEIKAWSKTASDPLPGGYERIKDYFKDGFTVYAFEFSDAGKTSRRSMDGLVFVNGHWRAFPKAFRAEK